MPGTAVQAGESFAAGIRSEALSTYKRHRRGPDSRLARVMSLGLPSTRRTETYFFYKSAPHIVYWRRNQAIEEKAFGGVAFTVTNKRFARKIPYFRDDARHDQTRDLLAHARGLGESAADLDERIYFQIVNGSSDADHLPSIPLSPDGHALYSTTNDGSTPRFGVAGGNILTGSGNVNGVASAAAVRTDFFALLSRFHRFQDTEGQQLFGDNVLTGPIWLVYGSANIEVFIEAFRQEITMATNAAPAGVAGVSNSILAGGLDVRLWSTPKITTNKWLATLENAPMKPVFAQNDEDLREVQYTDQNSQEALDYDRWAVSFRMSRGYGIFEPYASIFVDN